MNRVVLINCYFGKFPNYFDLWYNSAINNPEFDFIIFTDNKEWKSFKNIKFINITFDQIKVYFQELFDFKIIINEPYKLCDYKPVYGEAFKKYIKEYEFWGYVDLDLILGNLKTFITDDILNNSDKINKFGHLEIFRNNYKMNKLYLIDNHSTIYNYKKVFRTKLCCHFDEHHGVSTIAENEKNIRINNINKFFDVDYSKYCFKKSECNNMISYIFEYLNGNLFSICIKNGKILKTEIMYVHLQKRKMEISYKLNKDEYLIIPNRFIEKVNITKELIDNNTVNINYLDWKLTKRKIFINKIKNNAIQEKIYRIIRKKYIELVFKTKINMK